MFVGNVLVNHHETITRPLGSQGYSCIRNQWDKLSPSENLVSFYDGQSEMGSSNYDTWYWHFGFGKKTFQSFVLYGINGTNFVRGKHLVLFAMGNEKCVVPIGIHDIDGLVSRKKHFNLSFYWESMGQIGLVQESSFFSWWAMRNGQFPYWYTILMLVFREKNISTLITNHSTHSHIGVWWMTQHTTHSHDIANQRDKLHSWQDDVLSLCT